MLCQKSLRVISIRKTALAFISIAVLITLLLVPSPAFAGTNVGATAKINAIKTTTGFKPGSCGWTNWKNPSSSYLSNCSEGCFCFAANTAYQMYGCWPSGTNGYRLTNPGNFNTVGQVLDTPTANPSYSDVQALIKRAYPGDIIQFKGGPSGWGSFQHTAIVEAVDANGVRIYDHSEKSHVSSKYYNWSAFYNIYLDFDVFTSYTKGITLYHFKNYDSKFPSHTHNHTKLVKNSYSYRQNSGNKHNVTGTYQCSCGSTTTKTTTENCSYSNGKCSRCGITRTTPYAFKPVTIDEGVYTIRLAKNESYVAEIQGGSSDNGANARLYKLNNGGAQLFSFVRNVDDGSYCIVNIQSGKALETDGWNKNDGGNICQENWITTHDNKRWYIGKLVDGTYVFKNKHSGRFLECKGGATENGTNIQQYSGNFENNNFKNAQKWVLAKSTIMDPSITSLFVRDDTIFAYWNKQESFNDGFQIRYATKKDMSDAKMVTEPYASSLGKHVSGFKLGTTYYVQVRSYKHPYGSNGWFCSAWSPTKAVTTEVKSATNQDAAASKPITKPSTSGTADQSQTPNSPQKPSAKPSTNTSKPDNSTESPTRITTKKTSITKLTRSKRSFTVRWKKQPKYASGYQVRYSTDKRFKKEVKTKLIKGSKKSSAKISKLKSGKKYYVQVRTYKQVNKTRYYSAWSKTKTVKTKK